MTSWFNNLASQIKESVPSSNVSDLIGALTFQTPELAAEQARINEEEQRKESVKDSLAALLPWDTRNEEHEILIAECREEILALSMNEETFAGPFGKDSTEAEAKATRSLDDFPTLLKNFDLDAHVGLIQKLFSNDKNLVEMHSQFSGVGDAEYYFWKNYFYHCAVIRSRIGLSNSEIWDVPTISSKNESQKASSSSLATSTTQESSENLQNTSSSGVRNDINIPHESVPDDSVGVTNASSARTASLDKDYEIVSPPIGQNSLDVGGNSDGDDELDDLEAEIARELES